MKQRSSSGAYWTTLLLIICFATDKTVWSNNTLSICILPQEPACKVTNALYTGPTVGEHSVGDFGTCAVLCIWNTNCFGLSFNQESEQCSLYSSVTGCEVDREEFTSSTLCYRSLTGTSYSWSGTLTTQVTELEKGSQHVLSCEVPELEKFVFVDSSVPTSHRWFKRESNLDEKIELSATEKDLIFEEVKAVDGGYYSCEMSLFSGGILTLESPETHLHVTYLETGFRAVPAATTYTEGSEEVVMRCAAPLSNPPAIVEWFKGSPSNNRVVSEVAGLQFLITNSDLVIFNPSSEIVDGNYFCRARNAVLEVVRSTAPANLRQENQASRSTTVSKSHQRKTRDTELPEQFGDWLADEHAARCVFYAVLDEPTTWQIGDETVISSGDGVWILEGTQVLMISPDKLLQLSQQGISTVTCSRGGEVLAILLPVLDPEVVEQEIVEKTVMLKLTPDPHGVIETAGSIFQELVVVEGMLAGSSKLPASEELLQYIALSGGSCEEYTISSLKGDLTFPSGSLGSTVYRECPGSEDSTSVGATTSVAATCKITSPLTVSWDVSFPASCNVNHIQAATLGSSTIELGETDEVSLTTTTGSILLDTFLENLSREEMYFSSSEMIEVTIETLTKALSSNLVDYETKSRVTFLLRTFMSYTEKDSGSSASTKEDDKITTILWSVDFPLDEMELLSVMSTEAGVDSVEFQLKLPVGLNSILEPGSQNFLLSLYSRPEYYVSSTDNGLDYLTKILEIDPPVTLNNLSSSQEIFIAFGIQESLVSGDVACYYFDIQAQRWSREGVTTLGYSAEEGLLECSSNHLTAFSVLVSTGKLPGVHGEILSYLTYVCGSLSCLSLILTIIALAPFKELRRSNSNKIHINLSAVLLLATLLFLIGIERTESPLLCQIIAIALHYLWLSVFVWTVAEAYNLYLLFIKILPSDSSNFIYKLAAPAFIIPAIIVGFTAGFSYDSYRNTIHCSLTGNIVYYAFVAPIGVTLLINACVFLAVVWKIFKKGRYQRYEKRSQKALSRLKAISTLSCVLGLTWVFGLLTFEHEADIVFHYLFAIFNTLQGCIIFICHCVIKPDVRQKWLYVLCNVGSDLKSYPSSRATTPSKSRLDLLASIFTKRNSTTTLSTTATKLSLTKQLTRQRTNSNGSLQFAITTAALNNATKLEPLEEKDSVATRGSAAAAGPTRVVQSKQPLKPMLSSHSGDVSCNDLDLTTVAPMTPPEPEPTLPSLPGLLSTIPTKNFSERPSKVSVNEVLETFAPAAHTAVDKRRVRKSRSYLRRQVITKSGKRTPWLEDIASDPVDEINSDSSLEDRLSTGGRSQKYQSTVIISDHGDSSDNNYSAIHNSKDENIAGSCNSESIDHHSIPCNGYDSDHSNASQNRDHSNASQNRDHSNASQNRDHSNASQNRDHSNASQNRDHSNASPQSFRSVTFAERLTPPLTSLFVRNTARVSPEPISQLEHTQPEQTPLSDKLNELEEWMF